MFDDGVNVSVINTYDFVAPNGSAGDVLIESVATGGQNITVSQIIADDPNTNPANSSRVSLITYQGNIVEVGPEAGGFDIQADELVLRAATGISLDNTAVSALNAYNGTSGAIVVTNTAPSPPTSPYLPGLTIVDLVVPGVGGGVTNNGGDIQIIENSPIIINSSVFATGNILLVANDNLPNDGYITVNAPVSNSDATGYVALVAAHDININADITTPGFGILAADAPPAVVPFPFVNLGLGVGAINQISPLVKVTATGLLLYGQAIGAFGNPILTEAGYLIAFGGSPAGGAGAGDIYLAEQDQIALIYMSTENGVIEVTSAGDMEVDTLIAGGTNHIWLNSGGVINQTTAAVGIGIIADEFRFDAAGAVTLNNTNNDVNTIAGQTTAAGDIQFTDVDDLTVGIVQGLSGITSFNGDITINTGGLLTIAQNIDANSDIWLNSGGAINQTGGAITADGLRFDAAGYVTLTQAGNDVDTIAGQTTAAGDIQFTDVDDLTVDTVQGLSGITSFNGDITINTGALLTIAQNIDANSDIFLNSGGAINQTGGAITADGLEFNAVGFVTLLQPGNDVDTISGQTTAAGDVQYADMDNITIGNVSAISGINANGGAAGDDVGITAGTTIAQTGGSPIIADGLMFNAGGAVTLTEGTNDVNTIAGLTTAAGAIQYTDFDDLIIGPVVLGLAGITSFDGTITIITGAQMTVDNVVAGGSGNVNLTANTGNILLGLVTAADDDVSITVTAGNLTDNNAGANNVTADLLTLNVSGDVGSLADPIETEVNALTITAATNAYIDEFNDIILNNINVTTLFDLNTHNNGSVTSAALTTVVANTLDINADGAIDINTNVTQITLATTNDNIIVNETNGLAVNTINAGTGDVTLNLAAGAVTDNNGAANNVTADELNITAPGGINLDTIINTFGANTTPAGNIVIREANGLDLNDVNAGTGDVTLTLAAGALASNPGTKITADQVFLTAPAGININTNINEITAATTNANIIVVEDNGLSVQTINAGTGDVTLTLLAGAVTDGNAGANNVTADELTITAPSGIDLDTTVQTLAADTTGNNGDVNIREFDDLGLNLVDAGTGNVDISAGGAISDNNGINGNIIGTDLILAALNGIGAIDAIETQVARLQATNTNNDIRITNYGDLILDELSAPPLGYAVSNTNGGIYITAATLSSLTVDEDVIGGGDIELIAGDNDSANDDHLTVNANYNITAGGNMLLQAGDDITQAAGTGVISAGGGDIDLIAGHDNDGDGLINIAGKVGSGAENLYMEADQTITALTNVATLTAQTNNADITVTEDNGLGLNNVDAGTGDVTLTLLAGALTSNPGTEITGNQVFLTAPAGINVNTNIDELTAATTNADIVVTEDNGLTINDINAGTGDVTFTLLAGALTSNGATKITGNDLVINGAGAIDVNTNVDTLAASTNNANIIIDEDSGLALNLVDAGTGDVSITLAAGAITDNNGASTNIIGNDLTLTAIDGIGSGDALETDVDNLQATNTNNGIEITNTGALTLKDINSLGYAVSNTNGWVTIIALSPLTVDSHVYDGMDIVLIAGDNDVANNDDLTIATNVNIQSTGGDVLLQAGDDVVQVVGAGIVSAGGGDIQIIASHDNDGIGLIAMAGTVGSGNESLTLFADQGINLSNAQVAQLNAYNISSGDISITNTGNLTIDDFSLGTGWGVENDNGEITIINTGSIDIPGTSGRGVIATGDILLQALGATSDITSGSAASMEPAIGSTGGNVTLEAGRDIYLGQNHYADIYTDSGPGSITLTAGNDITIDHDTYIESASGLINMTAGNNLSLISTGHISSTTGNISLTATSGNIVIGPNAGGVISTSGDILLSAGNNIDLGVLQTSGDVTLTLLTGAVTDNNGATLNVTGDDLVITAPGGVDLDTSVNTLAADTTGSNGNVTIREADGLALNLVDAGTGDVSITLTAGAITDNNGVSTNIIGDDLTLSAVDGIGSSDALETQVNTLTAANTNNGIEILNEGGLTIVAPGVANPNGWVYITALSPLNVNANVTDGMDIVLVAGDNDAANNDDLTIAANVNIQSTSGDILLQAGDDITQAAGTGVISAGGGDIDLLAGHDNDGNGLINILGKVGSGAENLYVEADQTITALTNVATLTAQTDDADITVTEDNGLGLNLVDAGTGNVTISLSGGAITDNNGSSNNVNATDLILSAVTGIGSGDSLEMTVDRLAVRVTTGNENLRVTNTGDLTLANLAGWGYSISNAGTGYIDIEVNSNILIGSPVIGDNTRLAANSGAIFDANETGNDIQELTAGAGNLQLVAVTGIGSMGDGATSAAIETDVTNLSASSTTGPININELSALNIATVVVEANTLSGVSTTGRIDLNVGGALTQNNGNNITSNGGNITINATSLTQNDDSAINAQTGGNVNLTTTGNISLDSISGADVTLTSNSGAISETGAGDAGIDITANNLILSASTGIGSGNALETDVDNLQATNTNNGVEIANTGGMTIMGTGVSNTNGWVALSTSGALTVNSSVNAGGYVALTATGGANGDVTINADITANGVSGTTGNGVRILSDDDVIQNANITSNNTIGAVYVEAGIGTTDGIITMANGTSTTSQNDNGAVNSIEYKADGDIAISLLSSTGTVKVTTATGAIIDNNLGSNNINGNTAILTAANGIGYGGATANALETTISNLSASNSTSGDIRIDNGGDLNIIAPGVINSASGGVIFIDVASNLNVNANVTSNNGVIALTATDSIIQSTGTLIGSTGGAITLWADTDDDGVGGITQNGTASIVSGGGNILLNAGVATGGGNILLTRLDAGTGSVYVITYNGSIIDNDSGIDSVDILADADSGLYAGGGIIGWEYNPVTGIWTRDPIDVDTGRLYVYASDVAGPYPVSVDIRGVAEIDVSDDWGTPPGLILYNDSIVGGGNIEDLYRAATPDLDTKNYEFSQYLQWLLETIVDDELSEALDQDDGAKMKKKKWWRYITR